MPRPMILGFTHGGRSYDTRARVRNPDPDSKFNYTELKNAARSASAPAPTPDRGMTRSCFLFLEPVRAGRLGDWGIVLEVELGKRGSRTRRRKHEFEPGGKGKKENRTAKKKNRRKPSAPHGPAQSTDNPIPALVSTHSLAAVSNGQSRTSSQSHNDAYPAQPITSRARRHITPHDCTAPRRICILSLSISVRGRKEGRNGGTQDACRVLSRTAASLNAPESNLRSTHHRWHDPCIPPSVPPTGTIYPSRRGVTVLGRCPTRGWIEGSADAFGIEAVTPSSQLRVRRRAMWWPESTDLDASA
ncbi:hypothetical protein C8R44DRAFT_723571 [Mycena epipterygia]|nr:hypothetical protein C8R44DRAFT_723571 [Mycena epipterygia]